MVQAYLEALHGINTFPVRFRPKFFAGILRNFSSSARRSYPERNITPTKLKEQKYAILNLQIGKNCDGRSANEICLPGNPHLMNTHRSKYDRAINRGNFAVKLCTD